MPVWLFWLQLVIIVFLATVILKRDMEIKEKITGIFGGIIKKIHHTKIRLQIKKEQQKFTEGLIVLGKKTWAEKINVPAADQLFSEIARLEQTIRYNTGQIEKNKLQSEKKKKELGDFQIAQKEKIKNLENLKNPFSEADSQLKTELNDLFRQIKEIEKQKTQLNKEKAAAESELTQTAHDKELSMIDKSGISDDLEPRISEIKDRLKLCYQNLEQLLGKRQLAENRKKANDEKLAEYNQQIAQLSEQEKQFSKQINKTIQEFSKLQQEFEFHSAELENQLLPWFEKLGQHVNSQRIDHPALRSAYQTIDQINKTIQSFQQQLKSE
jgi:chromosome segregation ATPase